MFVKADSTKSKLQAMQEYLNDVNENNYNNLPMYVAGIFSYKQEATIEFWLQNSGSMEVNTTKEWPLFFLLATERKERERLAIPVAAFWHW